AAGPGGAERGLFLVPALQDRRRRQAACGVPARTGLARGHGSRTGREARHRHGRKKCQEAPAGARADARRVAMRAQLCQWQPPQVAITTTLTTTEALTSWSSRRAVIVCWPAPSIVLKVAPVPIWPLMLEVHRSCADR